MTHHIASPPKFRLPTKVWEQIRQQKRQEAGRQMWKANRNRCAYCRVFTLEEDRTVDHLIPVSRGGKDTIGNFAPACRRCNGEKGRMLPLDFVIWRMRKAERKGAQAK